MAMRFFFCILLFPVDKTDITLLLETTEALQIIRDIGQTVHKRILVVLSHLATHPLTGCGSVCCFQEKKKASKLWNKRSAEIA